MITKSGSSTKRAGFCSLYGGINLEDIAAPRCFEIEARLREMLDIPVFHDDQHGTAIVVLAALTNALRVVGKALGDVRIVVSGAGAAGQAVIRLLLAQGAQDVVAFDTRGAVHSGRDALDTRPCSPAAAFLSSALPQRRTCSSSARGTSAGAPARPTMRSVLYLKALLANGARPLVQELTSRRSRRCT